MRAAGTRRVTIAATMARGFPFKAAAAAAAARRAAVVRMVAAISFAGVTVAAPAAEPLAVQVGSLDRDAAAGAPLQLPAFWFDVRPPDGAAGAPARPALLLLHGCGGLRGAGGGLAARYRELAAWLGALGIQALVTDSLTPRGERELCTQPLAGRRVTQRERRLDALGALQWLAARPGVDARRIGVLGWSHGGSAVLAATNLRHPDVRGAGVLPSLAVAYYPGCEAERRRGYEPAAPLLMLLGEADDWTPAAPCKALAGEARAGAPDRAPQWEAYEGAHHGFDGTAPVRHLAAVPNGVRPGAGVHVGGNPAAREASRRRLEQFLRESWRLDG